ncbi:hypothetical protein L2Y96_13065 [Luteibacter aegosomaticola]|uniref:hypothetical protein n=1 Tax=Luteibacter aegosomaticola TaxID=2911538 RepID=UPI001FF81D3E|nr:hypothetical protein [Luteibacter aegosomaticola]UPG88350.1 hypothetical protein L2Y96_13065 [Luteibacter aegosomaticola]
MENHRFGFCAISATLLLALVPALALAAPPSGRLEGLAQHANTDVATRVDITGKSANIHFDAPFSCDITATYLKDDNGASLFRFNLSTNGGSFCDGLKKEIAFKPAKAKDGSAIWHISFSSKNNDWTGQLAPAGKP